MGERVRGRGGSREGDRWKAASLADGEEGSKGGGRGPAQRAGSNEDTRAGGKEKRWPGSRWLQCLDSHRVSGGEGRRPICIRIEPWLGQKGKQQTGLDPITRMAGGEKKARGRQFLTVHINGVERGHCEAERSPLRGGSERDRRCAIARGGGGAGGEGRGGLGICMDRRATGGRRKGLRKDDATFSTMTLFRAGDPGELGWLGGPDDRRGFGLR